MLHKIIIGCPYTKMRDLNKALRYFGCKKDSIVNFEEIIKFSQNKVWTIDKTYELAEFKSSYLRYPYDLIPPHSATYMKREGTEFLKSVALLFDNVAVNSLSNSWMLRNRAYSLKQVNDFGANIGDFYCVRKSSGKLFETNVSNDKMVVKAMGNCFVSEKKDIISKNGGKFFRIEEDDGDVAIIYPASLLNLKERNIYLQDNKYMFMQKSIDTTEEFRGYLVKDKIFIYSRDNINSFDKSSAKYLKTEYKISNITLNALKKLMIKHNLNYLCFDMILDNVLGEYIIDINPYGSMPKYDEHPEVLLALAKFMIFKK